MQALEPVTIADARAFLSLNIHDTEEDALLEMLIAGARAEAETYLRRHIAQQEVRIIHSAGPAVELADTPAFIQEVEWRRGLQDSEDITALCSLTEYNELITPADRNGILRITYVCEEYCPPQIKNALLMMVRNAYTDRSSDPMTEDIKSILAPHRVVRI